MQEHGNIGTSAAPEKFTVLYAGEHDRVHGLQTVLETAQILSGNQDIRFILAGDGEDKPALQLEARRLRLSNVEFMDPVPPEKLSALIASADACLFTLMAKDQGTGGFSTLHLFEYLAAGKPVICAAAGAIAKLVEENSAGLVASPENVKELAMAVVYMAKLPPGERWAMGRRGRALIERGVTDMDGTRGVTQIWSRRKRSSRGLVIIGAGGHAKVVADAALAAGYRIIGFLDDTATRAPVPGTQILGKLSAAVEMAEMLPTADFVLAVGENAVRRRMARILNPKGVSFATILHPAAVISSDARIGQGTVAMAGVVVNAGTTVGEHVILNTASSADHDCEIGNFVHLSPGVHLGGNVRVGEGAYLGVGVSVVPGCRIEDWSVVGAGGVVVRDIPPGVVAYGVPARPVHGLTADAET